MTIYIVITVLFLQASIGVILLAEKARNPVGMVHIFFFVLFVNVLHLAGLLGNNDYRYDITYYLLTQIVLLSYLILFTLGMLWLKEMRVAPLQERIFQSTMRINNGWLIAAFSAWLIVKAYLVMRYGASAFSLFSHLQGGNAVLHFYAWWETPVEFYARDFAVGACGVYVIKTILEKGFWRKHWVVTMAFSLFLAVYVGTHSSIVGPRRFMLLLVLLGLVTISWRYKKSVSKFVISKWRVALLVSIILLGAAGYYQSIRNNFLQPDIADKLLSGDLLTFAQGVGQAMIPTSENARVAAPAKYFREGPLSIVYEVIQKRGDGNHGTGGAITANAFLNAIPRIIAGEAKQDINPDNILYSQMGIVQLLNGIDPNAPDVATSLLAILIADYGLFGALFAPLILLFALTVFAALLRSRHLNNPLVTLYLFSSLLTVSGSVEGSLTIILTNFRDLLILVIALAPFLALKQLHPVQWMRSPLTNKRIICKN
ncbi:hypothetical protein BMS3Abin15_00745 [bacterium BMS3Abin15]|nr:hypothetical protein BMS3Abin15_00745 [bacterium BMS3Abin15]